MANSKQYRCAFTLIELLVSIAVIGLLVALMLPAVQRAREAARRVQCTSQIKQLSLAAQEFEGQYGHYPYGMGPRTFQFRGSERGCARCSTIMQLLRFLENGSTYDAIDFSIDNCRTEYVTKNGPIFRQRIPELLCPSSEEGVIIDDRGNNAHYVGNMGTEWNTVSQHGDGVFYDVSSVRPKSITDGLSQTSMFSERALTNMPSPAINDVPNETPVGYSAGWTDTRFFQENRFSQRDDLVDACTRHVESGESLEYYPFVTNWWASAGYNLFNHLLPPNHIMCVNYKQTYIYDNPHRPGSYPHGTFSPTSRHPGGVNVSMCDGSVHFVQDDVDLTVWRAMGSRNGGEVVGAR